MSLRGLDPGKLDRLITLRYPVVVRDNISGAIEGFADVLDCKAAYMPAGGREFFSSQAKQTDATAVFRIRYRVDVNEKWRVFFKGVIYELVTLPIELGRLQYLDLPCKACADQTANLYASAVAFMVNLEEGDLTKDIVFPTPFADTPRGLYVQFIIPEGGFVFPADPVSETLTESGFTVQLGAEVPGANYRLSITAAL